MNRSDPFVLAALVLVGLVVPGVADYALHSAGYPFLGKLAWVGGFGVLVVFAWVQWIRPLDIEGPDGEAEATERNLKGPNEANYEKE